MISHYILGSGEEKDSNENWRKPEGDNQDARNERLLNTEAIIAATQCQSARDTRTLEALERKNSAKSNDEERRETTGHEWE